MPAPRRVRRAPFVQWQAPLAWTTLSLTLFADGKAEGGLSGREPVPAPLGLRRRRGRLAAKSGLIDFTDWYRKSFGKQTPWGNQDSDAFVTAVESALERSLSQKLMTGAAKPRIKNVKPGTVLVEQGERGSDVYLVLDGVLRIEVDGKRLAEYGPGAMLGERSYLEGGRADLLARRGDRVPRGLGAGRRRSSASLSKSSPADTTGKTRARADRVRVHFLGVRGSTPAPGGAFVRYGGHTSCVALAHDGDEPSLIIDAGTGIRRASALLAGPFVGTDCLEPPALGSRARTSLLRGCRPRRTRASTSISPTSSTELTRSRCSRAACRRRTFRFAPTSCAARGAFTGS